MRTFEKNRVKANPVCPCGKNNKDGKFVTERGYAGQPIGYCHACGKNYKNGTITDGYVKPLHFTEPIVFCNSCTDAVNDNYDIDLQSSFAQFLVRRFGKDNATMVAEKYHLGNYNGNVIFWQIDGNYKGRAGKILSYNDNGKRSGFTTWWHSVSKEDCKLQQCFFGEHLINESNKPIAVVEGAKTACIMSILLPLYIWVSAESLGGLTNAKCETIEPYDVTLFPDAGYYDDWNKKAKEYGFKMNRDCEIWLEQGLIEKGNDIADYWLRNDVPFQEKVTIKYIDAEWNDWLDENPELIEKMNLKRI